MPIPLGGATCARAIRLPALGGDPHAGSAPRRTVAASPRAERAGTRIGLPSDNVPVPREDEDDRPGPRAAGTGHADPRARASRRAGDPAAAAVPRADGAARGRPRMLLGRRAAVLA